MHKGAELVLKTVNAIEQGDFPAQAQNESAVIKHAPKIFKETCQINWDQPRANVRNFVRGLSPYPAAWTLINGKTFKIFKCSYAHANSGLLQSGEFITDNKTYLYFKASDGLLSVDEFQPEGKKRMNVQEFFRGNKL